MNREQMIAWLTIEWLVPYCSEPRYLPSLRRNSREMGDGENAYGEAAIMERSGAINHLISDKLLAGRAVSNWDEVHDTLLRSFYAYLSRQMP